ARRQAQSEGDDRQRADRGACVNAAGRIACLALTCGLALAPEAARGGPLGLASRLNYGIAVGEMIPEGPQGVSLASGPYIAANVHGESALGMQLGFEVGYAASDDYLRQRFLSL